MTIVNTETGEILDAAAAERRAERISLRLDTIADNYLAVMPMIREAIEKRDDLALGYRSPGDYVSDRFGGSLQRLGVEVRREVVRELTAAGMSTRAIAPVVGVSQKTVDRDVRQVSHVTHLPQTPASESLGEDDDEAGQTPEAPVVGIDGKTYARPAATAPKRRALPDQFFDAAFDLAKVVKRIDRLVNDDRFTQNAEKVAAKHRDDLLRARDVLTDALNRMP